MEVIIFEQVIKIVVGEGVRALLKKIIGVVKTKRQLKQLSSSILKNLKNVFQNKSLDFEDYIKKFLSVDSLAALSESEFNTLIKMRLKEKLESQSLNLTIEEFKQSFIRDKNFISLHNLKKQFNHQFFYEIFGYSGLTDGHKEIIDVIREAFIIEFLNLYDTEDLLNYILLLDIDRHSDASKFIFYQRSKFTDEQFETYKNIWSALLKIRTHADSLWESARHWGMDRLLDSIIIAQDLILKLSIFIDSQHLKKLKKLLETFKFYYDGKAVFIALKGVKFQYSSYIERKKLNLTYKELGIKEVIKNKHNDYNVIFKFVVKLRLKGL